MRRRLLSEGAKELSYEIREIVKKANQLKALGLPIHWENIGDPIEKKCQVPEWIKDIVVSLAKENRSYGFGWTYGSSTQDANSEIAKKIRERIN